MFPILQNTTERPAIGRLVRVFPRKTKASPDDELAYFGPPNLFALGADEVHVSVAVLKRGLHGVYHHASAKHLFRYVDEFAFRLNEGNVARHTTRLDSFVDAVANKRLTYKRLIA